MNKEEKIFRKKLISTVEKFEKETECLAKQFDKPRCSSIKPIIGSHSIADSTLLNKIAENGKVLARKLDITRNFHILDKNNGIMDVPFESVPIKTASVFPGFCETHDRELFNRIDLPITNFDDEILTQFHYRAISYEYFHKIQAIKTCNFIKKENPVYPIDQISNNEQSCLNAIQASMNKCESAYLSQNYSNSIKGAVFSFDTITPTTCVGCWFPEMDIDGNPLFDIYDHTTIPVMAFTLGMDSSENSFFCITYTDDDENSSIAKFINTIETKHLNDNLLLNKLVIFSLIHSQNAYCKPSWFNSLQDDEKEFINFQFNNFEKDHYQDLSKDILKNLCNAKRIK